MAHDPDAFEDRIAALERAVFGAERPHVPEDERVLVAIVMRMGLHGHYAAILRELLVREYASRRHVIEAMDENRGEEAADPLALLGVVLHQLRKRLAPLGVEIVNLRGKGWMLTEADKAKLRVALNLPKG